MCLDSNKAEGQRLALVCNLTKHDSDSLNWAYYKIYRLHFIMAVQVAQVTQAH